MKVLRDATAEELPHLSDLCLQSKAWWGYDAAFMAACVAELTLTRQDIEDTALAVLEVDGRVAGLVQVGSDGGDAELLKLFVDPPLIGRGHGETLMGWALDVARQRGHRRLMIAADPGAAPFYQRFGAVRQGVVPSESIPGRELPWLAIELQPPSG